MLEFTCAQLVQSSREGLYYWVDAAIVIIQVLMKRLFVYFNEFCLHKCAFRNTNLNSPYNWVRKMKFCFFIILLLFVSLILEI